MRIGLTRRRGRLGDELEDCIPDLCIGRLSNNFAQERNEQVEILLVQPKSCVERGKLGIKRAAIAGMKSASGWKGQQC